MNDKDSNRGYVYDVVIVGGSFAGLSAALILARCNRHVLVVDESGSSGETSRNYAAKIVHGFLTHVDPTSPKDLLARGKRQISAYPNVQFMTGLAVKVCKAQMEIERVDATEELERRLSSEGRPEARTTSAGEEMRLRKPFFMCKMRDLLTQPGENDAWNGPRDDKTKDEKSKVASGEGEEKVIIHNGFEVNVVAGERSGAQTKAEDSGDKEAKEERYEVYTRKVIFATGVKDVLPTEIPKFDQFYGNGVWHCPVCDAFGYINEPVGVYGTDDAAEEAAQMAYEILIWTNNVTLFTNGMTELSEKVQNMLRRRPEIRVIYSKIIDLIGDEEEGEVKQDGKESQLKKVVVEDRLDDGSTTWEAIPCHALFFSTGRVQAPTIDYEKLGCKLDKKGDIECLETGTCKGVEGLYFAGNATTRRLMMVASAVGNGATVGFQANTDLMHEDIEEEMK